MTAPIPVELREFAEQACVLCGRVLSEDDDVRLRFNMAQAGQTALVHAKCAGAFDEGLANAHPSVLPLVGEMDGRNVRFELPDEAPDDAPIFLNGMCQLDGYDFVRIGRVIVSLGTRPSGSDVFSAMVTRR